MKTTAAPIECYDGNTREAKKLAIFSGTDRDGKVFFKIEAQNGQAVSAIAFLYQKEEAIRTLSELLAEFLSKQESLLTT